MMPSCTVSGRMSWCGMMSVVPFFGDSASTPGFASSMLLRPSWYLDEMSSSEMLPPGTS